MKITYIGSLPDGTLKDVLSGIEYEFENGKPIEVPDVFGRSVVSINVGTDKAPNILKSAIWEEVE